MTIFTIRDKLVKNWKKAACAVGAALFWLLIWQGAYLLVREEILIASPWSVLCRLIELGATGEFWVTAFSSLWRVLAGFLAALAGGTVLAVATSCCAACRALLKPAVSLIRATPVASFIILALVWIPSRQVPVFIAFLTVLPIVWANICEGIAQTDKTLLEMAEVFRFTWGKRMRLIYIPSVFPYFMASFTTGLGFAWKSGIAAEVIGNTRFSIGGQIHSAKVYLETVDLFAWTLVVIVLSILIEKLLVKAVYAALKGRRRVRKAGR